MPNLNAYPRYRVQFNWHSPNTKLLFAMGLASNRGNLDANMFREWGFVGQANPEQEFSTVIGKFNIDGGKIRYFISTHKRGPWDIGADEVQRDTAESAEYPYDELASADLNMRGEQLGTSYANAIANIPVFFNTMSRVRRYLTQGEFELGLIIAAGIRGDNPHYEVWTDKQADISIPLPESGLGYWKRYNETVPITAPTNLVASNQTGVQMEAGAVVSYATPGDAGIDKDFVMDIHNYLTTRTAERNGYDIRPAQLTFPSEYVDQRARNTQPEQYVMFVGSEVGTTWTKSAEFEKLQIGLMQAYGLKQGLTTGYLGQINNILIVENLYIPTFVSGSNKWCRCLIFGQQSLSFGFYNYNVPFRFRDYKRAGTVTTLDCQTPWRLRLQKLNQGKDCALLAEASGAFKKVSFPVPSFIDGYPGTTFSDPYGVPYSDDNPRIDRGVVCADVYLRVA